jgi:hypothetical protein
MRITAQPLQTKCCPGWYHSFSRYRVSWQSSWPRILSQWLGNRMLTCSHRKGDQQFSMFPSGNFHIWACCFSILPVSALSSVIAPVSLIWTTLSLCSSQLGTACETAAAERLPMSRALDKLSEVRGIVPFLNLTWNQQSGTKKKSWSSPFSLNKFQLGVPMPAQLEPFAQSYEYQCMPVLRDSFSFTHLLTIWLWIMKVDQASKQKNFIQSISWCLFR